MSTHGRTKTIEPRFSSAHFNASSANAERPQHDVLHGEETERESCLLGTAQHIPSLCGVIRYSYTSLERGTVMVHAPQQKAISVASRTVALFSPNSIMPSTCVVCDGKRKPTQILKQLGGGRCYKDC